MKDLTFRDHIGLIFLRLGARLIKSDNLRFKVSDDEYDIARYKPKHYRWDDFYYRLP